MSLPLSCITGGRGKEPEGGVRLRRGNEIEHIETWREMDNISESDRCPFIFSSDPHTA